MKFLRKVGRAFRNLNKADALKLGAKAVKWVVTAINHVAGLVVDAIIDLVEVGEIFAHAYQRNPGRR